MVSLVGARQGDKMVHFEYFEAATIKEAVSLLTRHREKVKVLAGGTDLIVQLRQREIKPQYIINIGHIPRLDHISYFGEQGLRIGALTTIRAIETSSTLQENCPLLCMAARKFGVLQVRNIATIGGNLCNAAPGADMAPPLIVLSAKVKIFGPSGERAIPLADFFIGPGHTVLTPEELLTEIHIPILPPHTGAVYLKRSIRKKDMAIAGVAAMIALSSRDEVCKDAKIALGGVAPTPIRAYKAEEAVRGKRIDDATIEQAAQVASIEAQPTSSFRASADYKRAMVKVLVKQACRQALELAKSA